VAGGRKKYRQPAVTQAVELWKLNHNEKAFTAKDIMQSGFIEFRLKTQHISEKSVSVILSILEKRGLVRVVENNGPSKAKTYQAV
jgi:prenyltransferase beta subunit